MIEPLIAYLKSSYLGWTLLVLVAWTLLPHLLRLVLARDLDWRAVVKAPEWGLIAGILAVLFVIYAMDKSRAFFGVYSDQNLIHNVALFGVLSIGAAIVIIAGGIDLSIGAVVALCSVVAAKLMTEWVAALRTVEALGVIRLSLASVALGTLLGLWAATHGERRRPAATAALGLATALAAGLAAATTLQGWSAWLTPSARVALVGTAVGVAIATQALGLLAAWRGGARGGWVVPTLALALTTAAGLAPFAKGSGPLATYGQVGQLELVVGSATLAMLVGLAMGLRWSAGLLALAVGAVVGLGITAAPTTGGGDPLRLIAASITLTLLLGLSIGLMHAVMINSLRLPPFIATLATLAGLRSLAIILGNNRSINVDFRAFRVLGRDNEYTVSIFAAVAVLTSLLMGASVLGRHLYALGGNEAAARLSGLPTRRLKSVAYGLSGLLAALGGLLFLGNTGSVQPATTGATYELYAITAAVVGGCSLSGGVGSVRGTVLGLILVRIVIQGTGIAVRGIDSTQIEGLVLGTVVVLAVGFNQRFRVRKA